MRDGLRKSAANYQKFRGSKRKENVISMRGASAVNRLVPNVGGKRNGKSCNGSSIRTQFASSVSHWRRVRNGIGTTS